METSNLLDAQFKPVVIRMLSELSEDPNSMKKDPVINEECTN